jgi:hypothetical protein
MAEDDMADSLAMNDQNALAAFKRDGAACLRGLKVPVWPPRLSFDSKST